MTLTIALIATLLVILTAIYLLLFRPWQLRWGARQHELDLAMPGDDIVTNPSFNATRAVSIQAPPEQIYPWIAQMGLGRAGWYSYDILDNLARKSAEQILPQYQDIQPGDVVPMSPNGKQGLYVKSFEPGRSMLWWDQIGDVSWAWVILPDGPQHSRLLTRVRMKYRWLSASIFFSLLIEFFDFPMMRKSMLGIKRRVEALALA